MSRSSSLSHLPSVQGLRAIAVLLVVLAHANVNLFSGGFVGVDVFFVLSGYLITGILLQEKEATGKISLSTFFSRRLKRLLPALLLVIAVTTVLAKLLLSNYELLELTQSLPYALSWLSNIFFSLTDVDYFSELRRHDLYLHTWSLGVEEQFYLIWPFFLLLSYRFSNQSNTKSSSSVKLLLCLLVVALISFMLSIYWSHTKPMWSFYLMPSRIWQFAIGAAVFVYAKSQQSTNNQLGAGHKIKFSCLSSFGLLLIFFSAIYLNDKAIYPGFWALLPSLGTAFVLMAIRRPNHTDSILSHRALTWLGDRSYSIYLWHWPILIIGFSLGMGESDGAVLSLILISLLLAMFSYSYIELPFWKGRYSRFSPAKSIVYSGLCISLAAVGLVAFKAAPVSQSQSVLSLAVSYAANDKPVVYQQDCDSFLDSAEINPCILQNGDFSKTIVLIGDSVLAQWYTLFPRIFSVPEWRVVLFTKSACPMVDEDIFYPLIGKVYDVCKSWRNAVLAALPDYSPDVVVIGSSATYDYTSEQWIQGFRRILNTIDGLAKQVIVIPGTPTLSFNGPGCLGRLYGQKNYQSFAKTGLDCSQPLDADKHKLTVSLLTEAAKPFPSVKLLDLNGLVCPDGVCRAKNLKGIIVYRDTSHITNTFVISVIPEVIEMLRGLTIEADTF